MQNYLLSCTVSEIYPSMGPKSLYLATSLLFKTLIPPMEGSLHRIYTVNDILLKLESLGYISAAESLGISSTTFTQCATKATDFGEITQNNSHYAV